MLLQLLSILLIFSNRAPSQTSADDDWWTREIVYQVYPRSFRDSNGDGIGDISGLIQKLPYISDLGARAVWLSPVYPSPMADFGYDISNYTDIDPMFGTMADFDRLVKEAHRRGMYLVMDFVPNHTSNRHPWFLASRSDPAGPYRDYYVWRDCQPPARDGERPAGVNNWLSNFGGSAWSYDATRRQCYLHQFCREQPDLNFTNPAVRAEMSRVVRFWLDRGVDGLRVDAIRHMFEDPGLRDEPVAAGPDWRTDNPTDYNYLKHVYTTDYNETYDVIAEWREIFDQVANATGRGRLLVAEAYSDIPALMRYYRWRGKRLADFPFNFGLLTASRRTAGADTFCDAGCLQAAAVVFLDSRPAGGWANWVLGNHDNARLASRFQPEGRFVKALNTLLLTLPGTPTCYYGDELGMVDIRLEPGQMVDPLGRRFPEQSRDPARAPMLWDGSRHAGFTDGPAEPWLPVEPGYRAKCASRQALFPNSTLSAFKAVAALRREEEFVRGALDFLLVTPPVLVYRRGGDDKAYIVALYISQSTDTLVLSLNAHCRSVQPVVDMRAANRNDFSVGSVAMQPGDAIVVQTLDCTGGRIKPSIARQRTEL